MGSKVHTCHRCGVACNGYYCRPCQIKKDYGKDSENPRVRWRERNKTIINPSADSM